MLDHETSIIVLFVDGVLDITPSTLTVGSSCHPSHHTKPKFLLSCVIVFDFLGYVGVSNVHILSCPRTRLPVEGKHLDGLRCALDTWLGDVCYRCCLWTWCWI